MTVIERRATLSLASVMSLRMIGLFMILPVFSLYAHTLEGATPFLIGLGMGIYGLTQGIFQIPFGMLSDHIGRKKVIVAGLLIFAIGSILAAVTDSMIGMIIARALQGAGAVGSTIIALIADLTDAKHRTKAMALIGMTIGLSFAGAFVLGPVLMPWIHVSGIFWLAAVFSAIAIAILIFIVPNPTAQTWHADAEPELNQFSRLLMHPQLAQLYFGIGVLHAILTASFVVIPISLQQYAGLTVSHQWWVYLPVLLIAFSLAVVGIVIAEKKRRLKGFYLIGIGLLSLAEILLWIFADHLWISVISLLLFFTGFSLLEAFLPSLVSRTAPPARKGTALGIYSCSQFLGIFVGGSVGGWLYGTFQLTDVYLFCLVLTLLWVIIAFKMKKLATT